MKRYLAAIAAFVQPFIVFILAGKDMTLLGGNLAFAYVLGIWLACMAVWLCAILEMDK